MIPIRCFGPGLTFVVLVAFAFHAVECATKLPVLLDLCANKSKVTVSTVSDVKHLAGQINSVGYGCSSFDKLTVSKLEQLVTYEPNDFCAPGRLEMMHDYFKSYIEPFDRHYEDDQQNQDIKKREKITLHKQLRRFVLAFGFKFSTACQQLWSEKLVERYENMLSKEERQWIDSMEHFDLGPLEQVLERPRDFHTLILPSELIQLVSQSKIQDESAQNMLAFQSKLSENAELLKTFCEYRLKPFYKRILTPAISLARMGFVVKSNKKKLELFKSNQWRLTTWYKITFICELFQAAKFFPCPDGECEQETTLKMMNNNQVAQLETDGEHDAFNVPPSTIEPIGFNVELNETSPVPESVWNPNDAGQYIRVMRYKPRSEYSQSRAKVGRLTLRQAIKLHKDYGSNVEPASVEPEEDEEVEKAKLFLTQMVVEEFVHESKPDSAVSGFRRDRKDRKDPKDRKGRKERKETDGNSNNWRFMLRRFDTSGVVKKSVLIVYNSVLEVGKSLYTFGKNVLKFVFGVVLAVVACVAHIIKSIVLGLWTFVREIFQIFPHKSRSNKEHPGQIPVAHNPPANNVPGLVGPPIGPGYPVAPDMHYYAQPPISRL